MGLQSVIYHAIFKRTSTFMITIVAGSFFLERSLDVATDTIFDSINKGLLWKDIKHKYEKDE